MLSPYNQTQNNQNNGEEIHDYGGLNLQGASSRSAKRPGDQGGGIRAGEHPLLNINGAKSSVNFYREGRTKKANKASTFTTSKSRLSPTLGANLNPTSA